MALNAKGMVYRCANCGHNEPKWLGRCPDCGQWNTLREAAQTQGRGDRAGETFPLPIKSIDPGEGLRFSTGFPEIDRVLGGGLMRGSVTLIGGEPGIGKSTLLLQLCSRVRASPGGGLRGARAPGGRTCPVDPCLQASGRSPAGRCEEGVKCQV